MGQEWFGGGIHQWAWVKGRGSSGSEDGLGQAHGLHALFPISVKCDYVLIRENESFDNGRLPSASHGPVDLKGPIFFLLFVICVSFCHILLGQ